MATHVAGWDALLAAVRRAPPSTAVLVEPFGGDASDPDPRLQLLLASAPLLPVVAAADLGSCIVPGARAVLEWGVSEVVDIRLEGTPEALGSRLRAAHGRPLKRRLEAGVSRYASAHAMTLVRAAAEVACDRGLSTGLAAVFGIKERTLGEWCTAEGLPPPRRLLAWIRVLLAVALLEEATRSWTSVARSTGYVDASGLRRAVNGLLSGVHGGASTRRPGFEPAIAAFDAELHTRRERLRSARKLHGEGCHVPGSRPLRRGWA
jgi:AraC-like DNA-binding protein